MLHTKAKPHWRILTCTFNPLLYENLQQNKQHTALIPQDYGLVQNLSVYHNVYMGQLERRATWYNLINLIKPFTEPVNEVTKILSRVTG